MAELDGTHRLLVEEARRQLGLSLHDLWIAYYELGGPAGSLELEAYLHGLMPLPAIQQDMLSHAINERFAEQGLPERLPYNFSI